MEQHVKLVSILNIINGALCIIGGLFFLALLAGIGFLTNDAIANAILRAVGIFISLLFFLIGIPGVVGGFQLLKHKESGRILTMIAGFINLLNFPIGTALGIYTIWVLFHKDIQTVIPNAEGAPIKF